MTQDRATPDSGANQTPDQTAYQHRVAGSYYAVLGIQPTASAQQVRQAYRDLSKLYHPDTTTLESAEAILKFQQLNEAYAALSNPERRRVYDQKIGYSRVAVVRPLPSLKQTPRAPAPSSAYLDPIDRPSLPVNCLQFSSWDSQSLAAWCWRSPLALRKVQASSIPSPPSSRRVSSRKILPHKILSHKILPHKIPFHRP